MLARRFKETIGTLVKQEKGQLMLLVMVFLLLGAIVVTPLLAFMSTGLRVGTQFQQDDDELYAADAGVTEAIWNLKTVSQMPRLGDPPQVISLLEAGPDDSPNNKTREVTVFCTAEHLDNHGNVSTGSYMITSTASSPDGAETTIEAYVDLYPFLFDYAALSTGGLTVKPGVTVNGPVAADPIDDSNGNGIINGRQDPAWDPDEWPFDVFTTYYAEETGFSTRNPLYELSTTLTGDVPMGWVDGDTTFTGNTTLEGTVFVNGDLFFDNGSSIDLNLYTIYVEGSISAHPGYPDLYGSGCIIAQDDIDFHPRTHTNPDDYVFLMSLTGTIFFAPNGDFCGSVAGNVSVDLWPGGTFTHTTPPPGFDFPGSGPTGVGSAVRIRTWKIIPPMESSGPILIITTHSLSDGTVSELYSDTLSASGGFPPYTWSITGLLPGGLSLDEDTGDITGTPTTAGSYPFTVIVTDSISLSVEKELSIDIIGALEITTDTLPNGHVGAAYSQQIEATGGLTPYAWATITGSLPDGLVLDPLTGIVSGTPVLPSGDFLFTAQVTDIASSTDTRLLLIIISVPPTVVTNPATVVIAGNKDATLNGELTALGDSGSATLSFEWGTDTTYGNTIAGTPASLSATGAFSAELTNLNKNKTYHYRAKAVGSDGSVVYGVDRTF